MGGKCWGRQLSMASSSASLKELLSLVVTIWMKWMQSAIGTIEAGEDIMDRMIV